MIQKTGQVSLASGLYIYAIQVDDGKITHQHWEKSQFFIRAFIFFDLITQSFCLLIILSSDFFLSRLFIRQPQFFIKLRVIWL